MNKKIYILFFLVPFLLLSCMKNEDINSGNNKQMTQSGISMVSSGKEIKYEELLKNIKGEYKDDSQFNTCMTNNVKMCYNSVVTQLAQKNNDASVCNDLNDETLIQACKQGIITAMAMKKSDASICDELNDNMKYNCQIQVYRDIATKKQDVSVCEKIPESNTGSGQMLMMNPKDSCMNDISVQLAMSKRDVNFCKKITDKMMKTHCEDMVKNILKNNLGTGTISQ